MHEKVSAIDFLTSEPDWLDEFLAQFSEEELGQLSLAEVLALHPAWESWVDSMPEGEQKRLLFEWDFWARPKQLIPPGDWRYWVLLAGRGFGKSRVGAEWVRDVCENDPLQRIMLIGPTRLDVRETMIEGESGLLSVCPPWNYPTYRPSRLLLKWAKGGRAKGYSADKPDRLRGPNLTGAWCDEFAAWTRREAYRMLRLCLRKGKPKCVITTTPKPTDEVRELVTKAEETPETYLLTRGSTYENQSNLASEFIDEIKELEGTTHGAQEIHAEIVENIEGALFKISQILRARKLPEKFDKICVSLDPTETASQSSDEFGMIVAARAGKQGYIIEDRSKVMGPEEWCRTALSLAARYNADLVVEINRGGLNLKRLLVLQAEALGVKMPRFHTVRATAGNSKEIRAEHSQLLYQLARILHVGYLLGLEKEMTTWVPGISSWSPNRMDALVWALHWLFPEVGQVKPQSSESKPNGW